MEDFQVTIAMLFLSGLMFFILFSICRCIGLWTWIINWLSSPREEKVNLTRSNGHYNANGYLVPAESTVDINLCHSGSFKRFETVDHDYVFEMSDFTCETTLQQPPEQPHNYPEIISMPYGRTRPTYDLFDPGASTSGTQSYRPESTSVFIPSPKHRRCPSSVGRFPPQPLRLAPSPSFSEMPVHEKYESEKPEKVKRPPRRPPPPMFPRVSPPPIPPRVRPPPLPPRRFPSEASVEREEALVQLQGLVRGVSFESISSDSSVLLADLDGPHVTGHLCVTVDDHGLNKYSVTVWEGKDFTGLEHDGHTIMDTFVRVEVLPDKIVCGQTKIIRNSNSPSYKDQFNFKSLPHELQYLVVYFFVFSTESEESTLIGEGQLHLSEYTAKQAMTKWVTLTDTGQFNNRWGEIMLSLNYLPTAGRLTVVVVKAKNLVFRGGRETGDPFVKVYLVKDGKKLSKKKTSTKRNERNPIYNEAMIFNVSASPLQNLELRVTVAEDNGEPKGYAIGHVIMGMEAIGKAFSHWLQMMTSPRHPISMWHGLARLDN